MPGSLGQGVILSNLLPASRSPAKPWDLVDYPKTQLPSLKQNQLSFSRLPSPQLLRTVQELPREETTLLGLFSVSRRVLHSAGRILTESRKIAHAALHVA